MPSMSSVLAPGAELEAGMSLSSSNSQFLLVMQHDGNLVEYSGGTPVWAAGTNETNPEGAFARMQTDGNLVIYDDAGHTLWASNTANNGGAYLSIDDLGQLAVDAGNGLPLWEPGLVSPGTDLTAGASIVLPGGQFRLTMQQDGNLVEYSSDGSAVWASGTNPSGTYAVMQKDGNLVVYNNSGAALWASNTAGNPGAFLTLGDLGQLAIESTSGSPLWELGTLPSGKQLTAGASIVPPGGQFHLTMQQDGNLVEYSSGGTAVWASGTNPSGSYAVMQKDGNLVVYNNSGAALWASNTAGNPGAFLTLNSQGQLVIDSLSGIPLWGPGIVNRGTVAVVPSTAQLAVGQSLMSASLPTGQQFQLKLQHDGNLVEYGDDGTVMWASGTNPSGVRAVMQSDGNLVVYDNAGNPLWASNTAGNPGAFLTLGDLGQLAIESTLGSPLWITSSGAPGESVAPSDVTAIAGAGVVSDAAAVVSWSAPIPSDGAPIWGYLVVASPGGASTFVSSPATTTVVTGLTDGTSYTFQVSALNSAGEGPLSSPLSNPVIPRSSPVSPGVPTGVEAVPGDDLITASWYAPSDDGGSPVTGYVVTVNPGEEQIVSGPTETVASVAGLENGVTYTVTVAATNAIGTSSQSQPSAPAMPAPTPFPNGSTVAADDDPNDWSMYNYDTSESDWNTAESTISTSTAPTIGVTATSNGLGFLQSSIPTVAFGHVFVGSNTGYETALAVGGLSQQWSTFLGTNGPVSTCPDLYPYGVVSAPTAATVNGTTNVIYLSGGDSAIYALDASTGAILWRTQLASPPNDFSFVSPMLYQGALYTGVASYGDCPLVQGQLFKINPLSGAVEATFDMAPNGCIGGGLWGSPSVDAAGHIFFATGTENESCTGTAEGVAGWQLETSVVEVDADLNLVSYWHLPEVDQITDSDFGSVPTIYNDLAAPGSGQVVAIANKDGTVYAF